MKFQILRRRVLRRTGLLPWRNVSEILPSGALATIIRTESATSGTSITSRTLTSLPSSTATLVSNFGLPANRFDPALLDMSTIMNHNTQYFNYIDLEASKARNAVDGAIIVGKRSLIFRRFHPDNLMHVIHDDLLPMYYTLLALDSQFSAMGGNDNEAFEMQLIFMEGWKSGPHRELYELFSVFPPIYKDDLLAEKKPICFTDAVVGLSKHTTWYQYGFEKPQGPIQDSNVSATDIHRFCSFVRTRLNISENNESKRKLDCVDNAEVTTA